MPSADTVWTRLPMELVLKIVEEGLRDHQLARAFSHVCVRLRKMALPILYTSLSPVEDTRTLMGFPEHLKPIVHNLWVESTPPPSTSALVAAKTAWIWSRVPNLALSSVLVEACLDVIDQDLEHADPPFCCKRLTTFGQNLLRHWEGEPNLSPLSTVTHLRLVEDVCMPDLLLMSRMPALEYIAVSLNRSNVVEQMAYVMALLTYHGKAVRMVALVLEPQDDRTFWMTRVRIAINIHHSLYVVPGAHSKDGIRKEWEEYVNGGEDIWQKASGLRQAVLDDDEEEVVRICSSALMSWQDSS